MQNFVKPGRMMTFTVPAGGILSGAGILVGSLFLVSAVTAAEGSSAEGAATGVFDLPKTAGNSFAQFGKVYWDSAAKTVTSTSAGNALVGVAANVVAGGDGTARVRLNGVSV